MSQRIQFDSDELDALLDRVLSGLEIQTPRSEEWNFWWRLVCKVERAVEREKRGRNVRRR